MKKTKMAESPADRVPAIVGLWMEETQATLRRSSTFPGATIVVMREAERAVRLMEIQTENLRKYVAELSRSLTIQS